MSDTLWYQNMAKAMAKREKALNAVTRWQAAVAEAEAEIQALRDGDVAVADDKFDDVKVPNQIEFHAPIPNL